MGACGNRRDRSGLHRLLRAALYRGGRFRRRRYRATGRLVLHADLDRFGVVGVAASVLWVVRALNKSACGDDTGCGCAPEPEADVAQPDGGQLQL
jgi:hypothetical protein